MSERSGSAPGSPDVSAQSTEDGDLTAATVDELRERAAARGIGTSVGMGKDELLDALGIRRDGNTGPTLP